MSFYDRFVFLCEQNNVKPSRAAEDCGINRSNVSNWKSNGSTPRDDAIRRIADYFNVSTDYLIGHADQKEKPVLTKKDERDISKDLEAIMADLEHSGDLMFDGNPMTDEARESMRNAIELGLKAVKLLNKETHTPKKYRKG